MTKQPVTKQPVTKQPATKQPARMRTAAATVAGGLTLGFEDSLRPREPVPIVTEDRRREPGGPILYFHPEVPEATLVLLRRRTL